ncbi:MAG TPA: Slp family lipoprotein [Nitrospira sp.]
MNLNKITLENMRRGFLSTASAFAIAGALLALSAVTGCSSGSVVPKDMESQIDPSVSFPDLRSQPDAYRGRTVLLGGEILSGRRVQAGTEFEVLQLPVTNDDPPAERRSESQGRFLAVNRGDLDPAAFPPGTRVTMVAEVTGDEIRQLDESRYRYPTVDVKHLHVWDDQAYGDRSRSSVGMFGGLGFGFGGGRGGSFGGVGMGTGF